MQIYIQNIYYMYIYYLDKCDVLYTYQQNFKQNSLSNEMMMVSWFRIQQILSGGSRSFGYGSTWKGNNKISNWNWSIAPLITEFRKYEDVYEVFFVISRNRITGFNFAERKSLSNIFEVICPI